MDVCTKSSGDRKVLYSSSRTYFSSCRSCLQSGGAWSAQKISAYTQGEHNPLPLMTKGENDLGFWCCHQVQMGRSLALWHRFGAMAQVLSLMATFFGNRSQFRHSESRKRHIRRFIYVYVGDHSFGPWQLDLGT